MVATVMMKIVSLLVVTAVVEVVGSSNGCNL